MAYGCLFTKYCMCGIRIGRKDLIKSNLPKRLATIEFNSCTIYYDSNL